MSVNNCYHCGADCGKKPIEFNNKYFCCNGCKTVYEILNTNELTCYYDLETTPGTIPSDIKGKYNYLDNEEIIEKLLEFNDTETFIYVCGNGTCKLPQTNLTKAIKNIKE